MSYKVSLLLAFPLVLAGCVALGFQVDAPAMTPAPGTYPAVKVNVRIACATPGATIHYTTDGSPPTAGSTVYSAAIPLTTTAAVRAIAVRSGMLDSKPSSAAYALTLRQFTLAGRLVYHGQPVSAWVKAEPSLWFQDDTAASAITDAIAYYDPDTSEYSVTNLPSSAVVGIGVSFTVWGGVNAFPGNYDGWEQVDLAALPPADGLAHDIPVSKHIRLLQPFDNVNKATMGDFPSYAPPTVSLQWEAIPEAATYRYSVSVFADPPSSTFVSAPVPSSGTVDTGVSLALAGSALDQHYQLSLEAYDASGAMVGNLMIAYFGGDGRVFMFKVQ